MARGSVSRRQKDLVPATQMMPLCDLPAAVLYQLAEVSGSARVLLSCTCSTMRSLLLQQKGGAAYNFRAALADHSMGCLKLIAAQHIDTVADVSKQARKARHLFNESLAAGFLEGAQWLHAHYPKVLHSHSICIAAETGSTALLEWVCSAFTGKERWVVAVELASVAVVAAKQGNTAMLQWVLAHCASSKARQTAAEWAVRAAALSNQPRMVAALQAQFPHLVPCSSTACVQQANPHKGPDGIRALVV